MYILPFRGLKRTLKLCRISSIVSKYEALGRFDQRPSNIRMPAQRYLTCAQNYLNLFKMYTLFMTEKVQQQSTRRRESSLKSTLVD